jgi:hypothetical protein
MISLFIIVYKNSVLDVSEITVLLNVGIMWYRMLLMIVLCLDNSIGLLS